MGVKRIVSLSAAGTEMVCALGLEDQLVCRSHTSDYPESVRSLPVCTAPPDTETCLAAQPFGRSASAARVNRQLIAELEPDLILTESEFPFMPAGEENLGTAAGGQAEDTVEVVALGTETLTGVFEDIRKVARALHVAARGETLIDDLQERIELIRHKLKFVENRPQVALFQWIEPLMIAGDWLPEMIEIAGGIPVLPGHPSASPINITHLLEANPDIIIISPRGFSIARSLQEMQVLFETNGWNELTAVKNGAVYIADGNGYFNRPGPRIAASIEMLAEIINPKQFVFGYEGEGWVKFG